jgi:hypothetical protein
MIRTGSEWRERVLRNAGVRDDSPANAAAGGNSRAVDLPNWRGEHGRRAA